MRGKFSFLYADIWFDVTKCKLIMKNSSFNVLVVFSPIFVADTKITFVYNFLAPLKIDDFRVSGANWWNIHAGMQNGLWTCITPWKSVRSQKMSSLVCGFICIPVPCAHIFLIPRPSGISWIWKYAPEDEVGKRYLTSNFMVSLHPSYILGQMLHVIFILKTDIIAV